MWFLLHQRARIYARNRVEGIGAYIVTAKCDHQTINRVRHGPGGVHLIVCDSFEEIWSAFAEARDV